LKEVSIEVIMAKQYNLLDAKILEAISALGPRNFTAVARKVGISRESLRYRLNRMQSNPNIFLRCLSTTYHTNLGLRKVVSVLTATPGYESTLLECLKANGFWIYLSRFYGKGEGCLATYTIPAEHSEEFKRFIQRIKELGVAKSSTLFWSTCFQPGALTSAWFDEEIGEWSFHWDKWIEQVQNESTDLPFTLQDPERFCNYADQIDIIMLKELEKDATKSIQDIANMLGISLQRAFYHYRKHLIGKKLLEDFEIFIYPHNSARCELYFFFFSFPDHETMAKFANSLLDKHFVRYVGKILNENKILSELLLPRDEFRGFIDQLSLLARMNLIESYDYIIMDLKTGQRQTFSYEFFKDGKWTYNHEKHMARLNDIVRGVQKS
jgi:DNA-binding Lrp family transcriptional regulator